MKKRLATLFLLSVFTTVFVFSQADSEFRGPNRDGKYDNEKLLKKWTENGPKLLQTISNLGLGYSSPAVTTDRIYITGMLDSTGFLFSYDLSGKLIWKKEYGKEWTLKYPGSRSTPTVAGDKIYLIDSFGKIHCFDKKGKMVWSLDMEKEFGFRTIDYGATESPLIEGDKLFCTPGGTEIMMAVLNRHNGEIIKTIKGNGQKSSHCSPTIVRHKNKKLLLTMTGQALVGIDMDNMELIFQEEIANKWGVNPNTPVYKDGYLFISTFVRGSKVVRINENNNSLCGIWDSTSIDVEAEGAVEIDGYIYCGASKKKTWYCIEMKTGKVMYADKEIIRKANVVFADGLLYTYNTSGYVTLVKPNPGELEVMGRFKVESGSREHVAHLVIKNGKLYVRHGDILNIYDVASLN